MIETRRCRYEPRAYQSDLHRSLKRFSVLVAHRRFGKTVFAVGQLVRMDLHRSPSLTQAAE